MGWTELLPAERSVACAGLRGLQPAVAAAAAAVAAAGGGGGGDTRPLGLPLSLCAFTNLKVRRPVPHLGAFWE